MQIEIKIDSSFTEPKIIVMTSSMTEDVQNIIKKLSEASPKIISGSKNENIRSNGFNSHLC